ncbi:hypothetical protein ACTXGQ_16410 [Marinobacter sp. 1Y8]
MSVITTEAQRQFYLSSMGVRQWYARDLLPGAAPTPVLDFREPESTLGDRNAVRPSAAKRASSGEESAQVNVKDLIKSVGGERPDEKKQEQNKKSVDPELPPVAPAPLTENNTAPVAERAEVSGVEQQVLAEALSDREFQLGIWLSANYCLLTPYSSDISDELQNRLAANILLALEDAPVDRYRLAWPVFNNSRVFSNPASDLGALLQNLRKEKIKARQIITLGALVDSEEGMAEIKSILGVAVVESPLSVAGLAADPRYKRELWRQLKTQVLGVQ